MTIQIGEVEVYIRRWVRREPAKEEAAAIGNGNRWTRREKEEVKKPQAEAGPSAAAGVAAAPPPARKKRKVIDKETGEEVDGEEWEDDMDVDAGKAGEDKKTEGEKKEDEKKKADDAIFGCNLFDHGGAGECGWLCLGAANAIQRGKTEKM